MTLDTPDTSGHQSADADSRQVPTVDVPECTEPGTPRAPSIYGSFWLDETEFALEAGVIREVVNEPATISPMPMSPSFMLGLFNLRGTIVPVVDLRRLLELPPVESKSRKIAIIEDDDLCIGLMVDTTGEVLNVQGASRVDFRPRKGQIKDVVVEGLLKLDDGDRIIQILDPYEILSLKKVPVGESPSNGRGTVSNSRGPKTNCISFQFGHTTCAIDLRHVHEVMEDPEIVESLLTHDCFIGITNIRGTIMPVADFRRFMGDAASIEDSMETPRIRKMLVVETDGGRIGLLVYSVDSIISYFQDEILQFTKLALPRADIVKGCLLGMENEIIMMLDHEVIRKDDILVDTANRCREIHPSEGTEASIEKTYSSMRRATFIVFEFDGYYALHSSQVSEVIDYPDTLLQPPYSVDFVDGIINLRGELISLINPRKVYDQPIDDTKKEKIVVFRHNSTKFGLLVNSVDEIVNTTEDKVAKLKTYHQNELSLQTVEDVCGCIQSPTLGNIMLLDLDAFLLRCFRRAGDKALEAELAG